MLSIAILAALGVLLALLLLTRQPVDSRESSPGPPPRDPIAEEVDKWAHDWERGRA
jgi:hypothetical protein